jgi:hypothetical protein
VRTSSVWCFSSYVRSGSRTRSAAVLHAVCAVLNARILTQTLLLGGKPTYINAAEDRNIANILEDGYRTWEYLSRIGQAG